MKHRTLKEKLKQENKTDLELIQIYSKNEIIQELLYDLEKDIKYVEKYKDSDISEDLEYGFTETIETIIMCCRALLNDYLLENGVEEAENDKFIYTKKFMVLAKDML